MRAFERVWSCFRYKDINHIMKCEHECTPLRLPGTMTDIVIFPHVRSFQIVISTISQQKPAPSNTPYWVRYAHTVHKKCTARGVVIIGVKGRDILETT
jgi:hypothetical protein